MVPRIQREELCSQGELPDMSWGLRQREMAMACHCFPLAKPYGNQRAGELADTLQAGQPPSPRAERIRVESSSKEDIGPVLSTPLGKPENEAAQVRDARWKDKILKISSGLLNPAEVEAALFLRFLPM